MRVGCSSESVCGTTPPWKKMLSEYRPREMQASPRTRNETWKASINVVLYFFTSDQNGVNIPKKVT